MLTETLYVRLGSLVGHYRDGEWHSTSCHFKRLLTRLSPGIGVGRTVQGEDDWLNQLCRQVPGLTPISRDEAIAELLRCNCSRCRGV